MPLWLLIGSLTVGAPALKVDRKPAKPPAGDWLIERVESNGHPIEEGRAPDAFKSTAQFTPTEFKALVGGAPFTERAAWFDAGGALEADFEGDDEKSTRKAIWKVEGDTLTICVAPPGDPRPTDYTAPKGSRRSLWIFKRKGE